MEKGGKNKQAIFLVKSTSEVTAQMALDKAVWSTCWIHLHFCWYVIQSLSIQALPSGLQKQEKACSQAAGGSSAQCPGDWSFPTTLPSWRCSPVPPTDRPYHLHDVNSAQHEPALFHRRPQASAWQGWSELDQRLSLCSSCNDFLHLFSDET